ncbi:hypothetical protein K2O51_31235 (plasmid) [Cupriavidus pinatubonensis]|uniref:hypothetical protein n=1 Tax=Cupriavidus pinatubonensis TaxID=248026 RepID=UPI001C73DDC4|nr:hypothetical protein [Cupriavidus pinatubonensis]QYY33718.1 hypothetical protein K2O51_31235 [Cupriavidus pinatubonensis]
MPTPTNTSVPEGEGRGRLGIASSAIVKMARRGLVPTGMPSADLATATGATLGSGLAANAPAAPVVRVKGRSTAEALPALAKDRYAPKATPFGASVLPRKELQITAAAAKGLTQLAAAVSLDPGSGPEVPREVRVAALNQLVEGAHLTADKLARTLVGPKGKIPDYLRARLLQQACFYIHEQWSKTGKFDAQSLLALSDDIFNGFVPAIDQQVIDLFHHAADYRKVDEREVARSRLQVSATKAVWSLLDDVKTVKISKWDTNAEPDAVFSFGRPPEDVASDLLTGVLKIVNENKVEVPDVDMATSWMQGAMGRAATLVGAEYRLLTSRILDNAHRNELLSQQALASATSLYPALIEKAAVRARNVFVKVETEAMNKLDVQLFKEFVKDAASTRQTTRSPAPAGTSNARADSESNQENENLNNQPDQAQRPSFSFRQRG